MNTLQHLADSVLAADVGHVWTRALFLERVAGRLRPIAQGKAPTSHHDVTLGVRRALKQIEATTGRHFFDERGELITPETLNGGVDRLIVTASAAPPLRVALVGLAEQLSLASARRAVHGSYSEIVTALALDTPGGRWGGAGGVAGLARRLSEPWPELLILTGGVEGSSDRDLLEVADGVRLAITARDPSLPLPTVIYAGNSALTEQVQARLGDEVPLLISDNVRPTLREERLRTTARLVEQHYLQRRIATMAGAERLARWADGPIVPTASALSRVVQYLALRSGQRALGLDCGGGSVTICSALPDHGTQTIVRSDLGLARGEGLAQAVGESRLTSWQTGFDSTSAALNDYLDGITPPTQLPDSRERLHLFQALARAALATALDEAGERWPRPLAGLAAPFDVVLGSGAAITQAPRPAQALAVMLDALQPIGVVQFYRDQSHLAPLIGAMAESAPQAAAALIENEGFEPLATVITPVGRARPGEPWLSFHAEQGEGVTHGTVEEGELFVLPLLDVTTLHLKPASGLDLGQGPGKEITLIGSSERVGFVIDARGRPLPESADPVSRRQRVLEWLNDVGA